MTSSFPAFSRLFMQTVDERWRVIDLSIYVWIHLALRTIYTAELTL